MHIDDVVHLQLQFVFTVGWIRCDATEPFPYRLTTAAGFVMAIAVVAIQRVGFSVVMLNGGRATAAVVLGGPVTQLLKKIGKKKQ